jgi:hypothetical protein
VNKKKEKEKEKEKECKEKDASQSLLMVFGSRMEWTLCRNFLTTIHIE